MTPILDLEDEDGDVSEDELQELLADLRTRLPQPSAGHWTTSDVAEHD